MDYNYFAAVAQPYQFSTYNNENSFSLDQGNDSSNVSPDHIDASLFLSHNFDYSNYDANALSGLSAGSLSDAASPNIGLQLPNGSVDSGIGLDAAAMGQMDLDLDGPQSARRSSSEEKDSLTPAQSRRKAQNRAAQRAFRERKEKHVRELEAKLTLLTSKTTTLQSDNERLKSLIQRIQTENEILRATSSASAPSHPAAPSVPSMVDDPRLLKRRRRSAAPNDDGQESDEDAKTSGSSRTSSVHTPGAASPAVLGGAGGRYLSAGATWDLLQSHALFKSGAVDVGEVCERLKGTARCEGQGPVFEEMEVLRVIDEVARNGGDELI